jgi:hypothetical protein
MVAGIQSGETTPEPPTQCLIDLQHGGHVAGLR